MIEFEKVEELKDTVDGLYQYAIAVEAMKKWKMNCPADAMVELITGYDSCLKELKKLIEEN